MIDGIELFDMMCQKLSNEPGKEYFSNGDSIFSARQEYVDAIADLIDDLCGAAVTATGYYDPEEDKRNGIEDEYTGKYYVCIP